MRERVCSVVVLYNVEMVLCSPAGGVGCQPPHPPRVSVLVPDLLLHFRISEGLQERTPDVCLALVPDAWDVEKFSLVSIMYNLKAF